MPESTESEGYVPRPEDFKKVENNFKYHTPKGSQPQRYEHIRAEARKFAETLLINCPQSRELSVALTNLETAVMWANAAIARNE